MVMLCGHCAAARIAGNGRPKRTTWNFVSEKEHPCENESRVLKAVEGVEAGIDWFDAHLWAAAPEGVVLATFDKSFSRRSAALGWKVDVRVPKRY